jgi:hypothetical protein
LSIGTAFTSIWFNRHERNIKHMMMDLMDTDTDRYTHTHTLMFWDTIPCYWTSGSHCLRGTQCHSRNDAAPHSRQAESSAALLWKPPWLKQPQ